MRPSSPRRPTGRWLQNDDEILALLASALRLAILGIKPESRSDKPAHFGPLYLLEAGYDIVPVPVYYPTVTEILGRRVYRTLASIPEPIDLLVVFRRAEHIPQHVDDIIAKRPGAVWFQLGIRNDDAARRLTEAGIDVVQDRCAMTEHERITEHGGYREQDG